MRDEIFGRGLTLRRLQSGFAPAIYEAAKESAGGEFTRWMPWCGEDYRLADTESFVRYAEQQWERALEYNFAIFDEEARRIAGMASLNQFNFQHNFVNLGYWVRVTSQRRGLASAAARLLAGAAFEDLTINRVEILVAAENLASRRAAEKSGAAREGVLRRRLQIADRVHDAVSYAFVREETADFGF